MHSDGIITLENFSQMAADHVKIIPSSLNTNYHHPNVRHASLALVPSSSWHWNYSLFQQNVCPDNSGVETFNLRLTDTFLSELK